MPLIEDYYTSLFCDLTKIFFFLINCKMKEFNLWRLISNAKTQIMNLLYIFLLSNPLL